LNIKLFKEHKFYRIRRQEGTTFEKGSIAFGKGEEDVFYYI